MSGTVRREEARVQQDGDLTSKPTANLVRGLGPGASVIWSTPSVCRGARVGCEAHGRPSAPWGLMALEEQHMSRSEPPSPPRSGGGGREWMYQSQTGPTLEFARSSW